ncbi:hypothetical protein QLY96_20230 [Cronobacter sakazakii]|uniref:hypothetical protein n=2 Tax=Cronobacter sakazakii TaxID=28141 RepID=UPI00294AE19D|nr:hypothetical protein [Cronobacter sakazakii]MDI7549268.1 hypothetical protein [Cronobacter sakazakii]MDI7611636.1 hypothetical protein [Cronobacter sakazakii]MDI7615188.1 hypothetical protein [Cronobacter sakazakii]MDK1124388.1 hypothetical protein [Cronobacter sakazakii]
MPVVPTTTGRQVESRGFSSPGFAAQSSPNLGDAVTAVGDKYVGALAEAKQRANVALTQEAILQLNAVGNDLLTNPDTGFLNLQGKNAIGKAQEYTQQFDQQVEQIAAGLPDEQARTAFLQQAQQERMQFSAQAGRHEVGQINAYEEGQFQATLTNSGKKAASMYGDNAAYVAVNKETFQQIEQFGIAHGWSHEQIQAKKVEFKEKSADAALSQWAANNAIGFIESNGELSDTPGGSRRAVDMSGQGAGVARGIRNNNPGNLEASDSNPWQGQTGSDGRFAKFETPEHGIRALGRNLISYQKQGIDTVNDIINRWAPPEDNNDTASYIQAVCAQLGVEPNQPVNASDPDTLKALCAAIIHHENGEQPYNAQQLSTGVNAALGIADLPSSNKRYTGNAAFDAASPQAQAAFLRQSEQMRNQQQAEYRALLDGRVRDANAAYQRGVEFPDAPSQTDFMAAYGVREGNARYIEFRNNQIAGQYIGAFRTLPTKSIESAVKGLEPGTDETGEGYAARAQTYDAVVRAAGEVIRQRQADPVQFSLASGQSKPINLNDQAGFAETIALRASQVEGLAQSYDTPLTFFSKEEANQIGAFFRDAPVSQQSAYLDTIHKSTGGGKTYMAALQQISVNAPSAAVAGILMDKPGGVVAEKNWFNPDVSVSPETASQTILAGAAARKGTKDVKGMVMPKENDMRLEFTDTVQDAFAGDAQGATMAYEVAKDYYAGVMSQKGDFSGELDNNVWKQAINVATGGTYDYNGMGNVLLPWGMAPEQFDKQVNQAWESQVVSAGIKAPPGQYGLQSYGDSQYLIKLGTGYLLKDDGSPVILDLTQQRQRFAGGIPQ